MEFIKQNLAEVEEKICNACMRAGRDRSEVTLIAVSKTKPVEMLETCIENGICVFGENKVQELCEKYDVLSKNLHWHLIGHLQRNKVKYITDKVDLIHSVDSLRLAEAISEDAVKKGITVNVLIEVNVAQEDTKFGIKTEEAEDLIRQIALLPNIYVKGLMTIAPYTEVSEENRPIFRILKQLSVDIDRKSIDNVSMNILSMGMTGDYEVAIEEGATMIRVGTGIFGERDYKNI